MSKRDDTGELRTERLTIRLTPSAKRALEQAAIADGRSMGGFVERLLRERAARPPIVSVPLWPSEPVKA